MKVEKIGRKQAEHILNYASTKEVVELAYKFWSLDKTKGIVALDLILGKLIGYSVGGDIKNRSTDKLEIIIFELDANVDVIDESILLGNAGVKELRSFFNIDDETFSTNMTFWTEKFLYAQNLTITKLRNRFLKVLYKDYKQAFFNSVIKDQLDTIYSCYEF